MRSTKEWMVVVLLVLLPWLIYGQTLGHGFVNIDDGTYVTRNPQVRGGLTRDNIAWAFTTYYAANWHPLTWLSLMVDAQWNGAATATAFHFTNVVLHMLNGLLLFEVFRRLTADVWGSFLVAAAFVVHPQHVESVAWVTERKDVLSTFFYLLAIYAHVRFVKRLSPAWYFAIVAAMILGLMAKPMLVTLPCLLLLLDVWPLRRLRLFARGETTADGDRDPAANGFAFLHRKVSLQVVLLEKLPLVVIAIASSAVSVRAQEAGGALRTLSDYHLVQRLANAITSYASYLWKTFCPTGLAVYYPYEMNARSAWALGLETCVIAVTTLAAIVWLTGSRRRVAFGVGWFWFVGTLVPVIGLVQVGSQAYADRYMYFPHIGLFAALVWGLWRTERVADPHLVASWCGDRDSVGPSPVDRAADGSAPSTASAEWTNAHVIGWGVACVALLAWTALSFAQTRHWRNSQTLLEHTIAVTGGNWLARFNLGTELQEQANELSRRSPRGRHPQGDDRRLHELAIEHFRETNRLAPLYTRAHNNLGASLAALERWDEAAAAYRAALAISSSRDDVRVNLGRALVESGQFSEALQELKTAVKQRPTARAHALMGRAHARLGETESALAAYRQALRVDPNFVDAAVDLSELIWQRRHSPDLTADRRERERVEGLSWAKTACELSHHNRADALWLAARWQAERQDFDTAHRTAALAKRVATETEDKPLLLEIDRTTPAWPNPSDPEN